LQFAPANATPKIAKEYVLPTLKAVRESSQLVTKYKRNSGFVLK